MFAARYGLDGVDRIWIDGASVGPTTPTTRQSVCSRTGSGSHEPPPQEERHAPSAHDRARPRHKFALLSDEQQNADALDAAKLLLVEAEKMSSRVVPAVMVTPLGESGIRVVREIMALNEEARRVLQEARDFHIAVFCTSEDDKLMALH